ncbi:MAG: hypothetical protein ACKODH_02760 [Limisphaerales bacterium]
MNRFLQWAGELLGIPLYGSFRFGCTLILIAFSCVTLTSGCKRSKPVASKSAVQQTASPLDPAAAGELKSVNEALTAYVNRTGQVPKDLAEAVAKGAIASPPVAPSGTKIHYDPVAPAIGFVPIN